MTKPSSSAFSAFEAEAAEEVLEVREDVVEQRPLARAVEGGDAEAGDDHRGGAVRPVDPPGADDGRPGVERAAVAGDRRERGEEAEVDAERVGVAGPRLDAVEAHPDEHHDEVDEHDDRDRRAARARCPSRARRCRSRRPRAPPASGPAAPGRRAARAGRSRGAIEPAGGAADRAPRADQPPDVAQEQADERHADPQRDVDHRRREVVAARRRVPASPAYAVTRNTRTPSAPRTTSAASGNGSRRRSRHSCSRGRDHSAGEREERQHQHRCRRGAEHRLRDRQVGATDDAVGEDDHGARVYERRRPRRGGAVERLRLPRERCYFEHFTLTSSRLRARGRSAVERVGELERAADLPAALRALVLETM